MTKLLKLNIIAPIATLVLLTASAGAFAGKSGGATSSRSKNRNIASGHATGKTTPADAKTSKPKNLDRPGLNDQIKNLESQQEEVRNKRQ